MIIGNVVVTTNCQFSSSFMRFLSFPFHKLIIQKIKTLTTFSHCKVLKKQQKQQQQQKTKMTGSVDDPSAKRMGDIKPFKDMTEIRSSHNASLHTVKHSEQIAITEWINK